MGEDFFVEFLRETLAFFPNFLYFCKNKGDGFASMACTTLDYDSPSRRRVVFLASSPNNLLTQYIYLFYDRDDF